MVEKKRLSFYISVAFGIISLPILVRAGTFRDFAGDIIDILNSVATLITGFALLAFIIGAIRFIATASDDSGREMGKQLMTWGIVALFLMIAVWGVVEVVQTTFFT